MIICLFSFLYVLQVYLDLQLMGKLLDLQHVQALHTKSVRERERFLLRLQEVQQKVDELEASLPGCKQEKKKAKKKVRQNGPYRSDNIKRILDLSQHAYKDDHTFAQKLLR